MWIERQLYRDGYFERLTPQEGWAFTSTVSRGYSDFRVADVVNRVKIQPCRIFIWGTGYCCRSRAHGLASHKIAEKFDLTREE
jgi:hypothetical protein